MKIYIDIIPKGTKLYRSKRDRSDLHGIWYAFIKEDTYGYGEITAEFETTKDIKLINVLHQDFYNDYINMLNLLYKNNDLKDAINLKLQSLYSIGFTNLELYKNFTKNFYDNIQQYPYNAILEYSLLFTHNRSRFSVSNFDDILFNALNLLYGSECDGFYWPIRTPNIFMNGFQHSELAIFDKSNIQFIQEVQRPVSGGSFLIDEDEPKTVYGITLTDPTIVNDLKKTEEYIKNLQIIKGNIKRHINSKKIFNKTRKSSKKSAPA